MQNVVFLKILNTLWWNHKKKKLSQYLQFELEFASPCWHIQRLKIEYVPTRGAGSEVWNRVYMIAPVKKFDRVRLSTICLQNKYGGECRHGSTMSFCSVISFAGSKHQEYVFNNIFNGIFGHQEAWCMNSSWVTTLIVIRHLGKFSHFLGSWISRDQPSLVSISCIFPSHFASHILGLSV